MLCEKMLFLPASVYVFVCLSLFLSVCPHVSVAEKLKKLENLEIASALQLEAARATPASSGFNYDAMPSLTSVNLSIAVL